MTTKRRPLCLAVFAVALSGLSFGILPTLVAAEANVLIQKLPEREAQAKRQAHQGWDSGVTGRMLEATNRYNDELAAMIADLAAANYQKAGIHRENVANYVRSLQDVVTFRHRLDNPTDEDRGTLDQLDVPSTVSNALEQTVEQMVKAVADSDHELDYAAWQKRWDAAKKTGDVQTP